MENSADHDEPSVVIGNCKIGGGWAGGISIEYASSALIHDCDIEARTAIELSHVKSSKVQRVKHTELGPEPISEDLGEAIRRVNRGDV